MGTIFCRRRGTRLPARSISQEKSDRLEKRIVEPPATGPSVLQGRTLRYEPFVGTGAHHHIASRDVIPTPQHSLQASSVTMQGEMYTVSDSGKELQLSAPPVTHPHSRSLASSKTDRRLSPGQSRLLHELLGQNIPGPTLAAVVEGMMNRDRGAASASGTGQPPLHPSREDIPPPYLPEGGRI